MLVWKKVRVLNKSYAGFEIKLALQMKNIDECYDIILRVDVDMYWIDCILLNNLYI